jgi:hypothetical protein
MGKLALSILMAALAVALTLFSVAVPAGGAIRISLIANPALRAVTVGADVAGRRHAAAHRVRRHTHGRFHFWARAASPRLG